MTAAGARKRVERLTALIKGFRKEAEALLAGRGVLTPEEWNHHAAAIYEVQDALQEARTALRMAARRRGKAPALGRGQMGTVVLLSYLATRHPWMLSVGGRFGAAAAEWRRAVRRWAGRLGGALVAVGVVNFTVFFVLSLAWGGDALNGKVEDGRFYLGHKGRYVEASEARWRESRAHAISVLVTHPLAIIGGGLLLNYAGRRRRA
jgi:hypothetical protein